MFTPGGQVDHLSFMGLRGGGKGGGGGGSNVYYTPPDLDRETTLVDPVDGTSYTSTPNTISGGGKTAAQQLNEHIAQRKAQELSDSSAAKAKADADAATAESTFKTKEQSAAEQATSDIGRTFVNAGVDPANYWQSYIQPALARTRAGIQDLDPNPMGSYDVNLGKDIINQAESDRRTGFTNQYNSIFSPDYSTRVLPDTLTSDYIDPILKDQFDPVSAQLVNAQKRGTLTDTGYAAALDRLNQKRTAARDTVSNLGASILATDRSKLDNLISGGRSDIASLPLSGSFDPWGYKTRADTQVGTDVSNFGGALRNAVGNTSFVDLADLINAGGAVQGANNPSAANPRGVPGGGPNSPDEELARRQRGLGNTGAF